MRSSSGHSSQADMHVYPAFLIRGAGSALYQMSHSQFRLPPYPNITAVGKGFARPDVLRIGSVGRPPTCLRADGKVLAIDNRDMHLPTAARPRGAWAFEPFERPHTTVNMGRHYVQPSASTSAVRMSTFGATVTATGMPLHYSSPTPRLNLHSSFGSSPSYGSLGSLTRSSTQPRLVPLDPLAMRDRHSMTPTSPPRYRGLWAHVHV